MVKSCEISCWILAPFLSEAVEASLCYFFKNWLMIIKLPNLWFTLHTSMWDTLYFIFICIFSNSCHRLRFYSLRIPFKQAAEFIYWPYLTVSIGQKIFNHSQEKLWDRNHLQTWSLSWLIWLKKQASIGNHWRRCMKTSLQKKELTRKNLLVHTENLIQSKFF